MDDDDNKSDTWSEHSIHSRGSYRTDNKEFYGPSDIDSDRDSTDSSVAEFFQYTKKEDIELYKNVSGGADICGAGNHGFATTTTVGGKNMLSKHIPRLAHYATIREIFIAKLINGMPFTCEFYDAAVNMNTKMCVIGLECGPHDIHYQRYMQSLKRNDNNSQPIISRHPLKPMFSEKDALTVLYRILYVLHNCAKVGLYNMDIKAANILFNPETLDVKVIDWGCSQWIFSHCSDKSWDISTYSSLGYAAPEMCVDCASERDDERDKEVGDGSTNAKTDSDESESSSDENMIFTKADIYAAGKVALEMLDICRAYKEFNFSQLDDKIRAAKISKPMKKLLVKCIMDDPVERLSTDSIYTLPIFNSLQRETLDFIPNYGGPKIEKFSELYVDGVALHPEYKPIVNFMRHVACDLHLLQSTLMFGIWCADKIIKKTNTLTKLQGLASLCLVAQIFEETPLGMSSFASYYKPKPQLLVDVWAIYELLEWNPVTKNEIQRMMKYVGASIACTITTHRDVFL